MWDQRKKWRFESWKKKWLKYQNKSWDIRPEDWISNFLSPSESISVSRGEGGGLGVWLPPGVCIPSEPEVSAPETREWSSLGLIGEGISSIVIADAVDMIFLGLIHMEPKTKIYTLV